jgi:hypothetical protein
MMTIHRHIPNRQIIQNMMMMIIQIQVDHYLKNLIIHPRIVVTMSLDHVLRKMTFLHQKVNRMVPVDFEKTLIMTVKISL